MLEIGRKIKGREVVFVSPDKRIWATYEADSMGAKGKIWGKMPVQNPTAEERAEYWDNAIQIIQIDGVWYRLLEYTQDYPEIFSRCRYYAENPASFYSRK
jgi:hypothetical protein